MIPLSNSGSYVTLCSYVDAHSDEQRKKWTHKRQPSRIGTPHKIKKPPTDAFLMRLLSKYDDDGYRRIPKWLRDAIESRGFVFKPRQPTEVEMWETVDDAREHRIMHRELTIRDYQDKYKRGKSLTLIA